MTNSFAELAHSKCLFVIGSNTTVAHPMVGMRLIEGRRNGGRLIVADPRRTALAKLADIHLRLRPGTDVPLINGLMHIICEHGWQNSNFISTRTENFEELHDSLRQWTPKYVADVTGVPQDMLLRAAELYARSEASAIVYCLGITQHRCGVNNVRSLANLAMLCGQVGRAYTGVNPLRGQNNVQGACDMGGLPNYYPGYQKVEDCAARAKFEAAWGCTLPARNGLTTIEMMHALHDGHIKAMIIMGENPVVSDPDAGHAAEALSRAEFLLCLDIFPTPTTELAHMVLPGASFAESEGTFTNSERRVQRVRQAIPPLAGRTNSQIIAALSRRLGHVMPNDEPCDIFDEMCALTPIMAGMSHARLDTQSLCWPCPHQEHPGTPILHQTGFTRGRGLFAAIPHVPPAELPDEEYPFLLSTGMRHAHYLTGTMTRRCGILERELPELTADIAPADARRLNIREGARMRLTSRRGSIVSRMHITDSVPEGVIFAPLHFAEAMVNLLTCPALDPVSKTPEYKISAIRLEKV
ncbi:MAG: molybdopterin-dependent oxidoreductase [Desulfovibrio sp.]|nr:molybdopterin-dependent oxidoreductase [Desulfovibrio sp.]